MRSSEGAPITGAPRRQIFVAGGEAAFGLSRITTLPTRTNVILTLSIVKGRARLQPGHQLAKVTRLQPLKERSTNVPPKEFGISDDENKELSPDLPPKPLKTKN